MGDIECDNCDAEQDDGEHWIHISVFHHDDPNYTGKWDKNNPDNFAATLCPDCGRAAIDAAGGGA